MQTDDLPAPLMQLSQTLVSGIVIVHRKMMNCFASQFKISSCRVYNRILRRKLPPDFVLPKMKSSEAAGAFPDIRLT
jgi:hypothetical protein